jgi:hypothetical protein
MTSSSSAGVQRSHCCAPRWNVRTDHSCAAGPAGQTCGYCCQAAQGYNATAPVPCNPLLPVIPENGGASASYPPTLRLSVPDWLPDYWLGRDRKERVRRRLMADGSHRMHAVLTSGRACACAHGPTVSLVSLRPHQGLRPPRTRVRSCTDRSSATRSQTPTSTKLTLPWA